MYGHSNGMFFGGGLLMWIFWLVLLLVLIYVLKNIFGSANKRSSSNEALEILKQRYARGEIDEAEFEQRKKQLE
jgi:putative membrane protein